MSAPELNRPVDDFEAPATGDQTIRLSGLKGQNVVLYFYPKDNTPGCTNQACNLNENLGALKAAGYKVLGVSKDPAKSHHKFIDKYGLGFDLLCDEELNVHHAFGVWGPKKFMGREFDGTHRTTFVIEADGTIGRIIAKPKVKAHAEEILQTEA